MGIVRNPANTMRRGRVGETTYYISGGQQIARQALNGSNYGTSARRSQTQQSRRVLWSNLVNFYKVSSGWMPKAFESKKRSQSDYNKFMSVNIGTATVALTKAEAAAGACIAAGYIVSQGSLPSIEVTATASAWYTNLKLGSLTIDDNTTVQQFALALVNNNGHCRIGQQLSFVSYQQSVDALGTPRLICRCYEVTLSDMNEDPLRDYLPEFCSQNLLGCLGTSDYISIGGFAYILSEQANNGLLVSTQQLVLNNDALIAQYTTESQHELAIASYGVDAEVILSPVSTNAQSAEAQPMYIARIKIANTSYNSGDYYGPMSGATTKAVEISLSSSKLDGVSSVSFIAENGTMAQQPSVTRDGNVIRLTAPTISTTSPLARVTVTLSDSRVVSISFKTSESIDGDL
ncbi:MAG: hypothetical protein MJZ25_16415 [Fibrobacter sp.]|nr:hypothetical protein [Fibrobacter sp.]